MSIKHDETQALFNAGIAKLYRIDILKKQIHEARRVGDYHGWVSGLSGWREEMSERMKDDEEQESNTYENKIQHLLSKKYEGFAEKNLKKYGIFLSKIEYKYGYSMPDKDQAGHALM